MNWKHYYIVVLKIEKSIKIIDKNFSEFSNYFLIFYWNLNIFDNFFYFWITKDIFYIYFWIFIKFSKIILPLGDNKILEVLALAAGTGVTELRVVLALVLILSANSAFSNAYNIFILIENSWKILIWNFLRNKLPLLLFLNVHFLLDFDTKKFSYFCFFNYKLL